MADFKDSQTKYIAAKRAYETAFRQAYLGRQQVLIIEKRIADFLKSNLLSQLPAGHPLALEKSNALTGLSAAQQNLAVVQNALKAARTEFGSVGIPSRTVANFNDATPFLLLPLKIQTRFSIIKSVARNIPNELLVDVNKAGDVYGRYLRSYFPNLKPTADPLASISSQAYSLSHNAAPGVKDLIAGLNKPAASGVAPSRWQKVEDEYVLYVRIFPDDIFMQTHETAITETERTAAKAFWQQVWEAERLFRKNTSDPAAALKTKGEQQLAAWKQLRAECLPHRASWLARIMRPADFPDGFSQDMVTIPDSKFPAPDIKSDSWTIPPGTDLLPEQFSVKLFFRNPDIPSREVSGTPVPEWVQLGFDPDEREETAFAEKDQVLTLPSSIRWLTDLAEAEKCGMAIRITLSQEEYWGISRLLVLGIKTAADAPEGGRLITKLFENHHYRPDGLAFLPQGTATNNLPGRPAGFNPAGLSDEESFRLEFAAPPAADARTDGQRLTTALGLDPALFESIAHTGGRDGEEALHINRALWPGSVGYYLDNYMRPSITDGDLAYIKSFFQNWVTGRGLLPALRIGKQPYGIIPASAWTAWKAETASQEENRLVKTLKKIDVQYNLLIEDVKTMKKVFANTDEQKLKREFRELLAYEASSTRYFRRLVAGEYLLWNINQRNEPANTEKVGIRHTPGEFKHRLESWGYWNEPVNPRLRILGKFYDDVNYKLTDVALEDASVATPLMSDGKNYLGILLNATPDQLRKNLFPDLSQFVVQRSSRLMFDMARFALSQAWIDAAVNLLRKERPVISPFARLDFEMEYLKEGKDISSEHLSLLWSAGLFGPFETRKNKWAFFDEVLADGRRLDAAIAQKMREPLGTDDPLKSLKETMAALTELAGLPVERLERLFSEHVDLCSFRLDAWLQGLVLARNAANRRKAGFEKGIYIGAYGYLENLAPSKEPWVQVQEIKAPAVFVPGTTGNDRAVMPVFDFSPFTAEQIAIVKKYVFVYLGSDTTTALKQAPSGGQIIQSPLPNQISAEGFVLTPSLEHAATASILRAGYEHHSLSQGTESATLAVNLDAERTGQAMDMLKAVNSGHTLNEQLGYFIERKMVDDLTLAQYVPALRAAFPLHIERNEWDDNQQINEQAKITNLELVTDGLAIVNKRQRPLSAPTWSDKLTAVFKTDQPAKTAFEKVVDGARDQFDAVSDLVLAESVYQTVKGSPERASAALRIASEGTDILLPEIAQVPSENRVLTHRTGFVLNAGGALERSWPSAAPAVSIMAQLSPYLNRWLADQLPSPSKIIAVVIDGNGKPVKIAASSLGLQAIDFYYLLRKAGGRPQESLLAWLFTEAARQLPVIDPHSKLEVLFNRMPDFEPDEWAIIETVPLVRTLGALLEKSRPLRPQDWQLPADAAAGDNAVLYDNDQLRAVCREYSDTSERKPMAQYTNKLRALREALEEHVAAGLGSPEAGDAFEQLMHAVPQALLLGCWDAAPRCLPVCDPVNARLLLEQAEQLIEQLEKRLADAGSLLLEEGKLSTVESGDKLFDLLVKISGVFAGEDFLVLPKFRLPNPAEIAAACNDAALQASIAEFGTEEWLQGLALVRENIRNYQMAGNLRETFEAPAGARRLKILQLPVAAGTPSAWIGGKFPANWAPPPQATSMAFEFSADFDAGQTVSGLLTDDWREKVPLPELTAGAAIKYNEPDSEAPQCMLLVVTPEQRGAWDWSVLMNTVLETMAMAKKRGVDTEVLQLTWLGQFLPALVTPLDAQGNTPNLDFRVAGPPALATPIVDLPTNPGGILTTS